MQIDKRKKERRTKSRNDATAAIALASAVGTRFAIFFLFRHLTAFFGPLEAKRMDMFQTVEIW